MKKQKLARIALLICGMHSVVVAAHGRGGGVPRHHHGGAVGHRSHYSYGLYFGAPLWGYPYYAYPYPSPPTVVTVPVTPPVYIQQTPPVAPQYPAGYWYYCQNPEGYYPYVSECPTGWQQVSPTPNR